MSQCFAYVSDVTNVKNRLLRIAIVQSSGILILGACQIAVGLLISEFGFLPPLWLVMSVFIMSLLYVIIPGLLIETVDRNKDKKSDGGHLKSSIKAGINDLTNLFKTNVNLRRWRLGVLYLIQFFRELLESSAQLVILYGLGSPFCWSPLNVSTYTIIITFGAAIGKLNFFVILSFFLFL